MPIPTWLKIGLVAFGVLFFACHLVVALRGVRSTPSRDERVEAAGLIVPGVAGLLFAVAVLAPWPLLGLVSAVASIPVLVLGRAAYECIVFRRGGRS